MAPRFPAAAGERHEGTRHRRRRPGTCAQGDGDASAGRGHTHVMVVVAYAAGLLAVPLGLHVLPCCSQGLGSWARLVRAQVGAGGWRGSCQGPSVGSGADGSSRCLWGPVQGRLGLATKDGKGCCGKGTQPSAQRYKLGEVPEGHSGFLPEKHARASAPTRTPLSTPSSHGVGGLPLPLWCAALVRVALLLERLCPVALTQAQAPSRGFPPHSVPQQHATAASTAGFARACAWRVGRARTAYGTPPRARQPA